MAESAPCVSNSHADSVKSLRSNFFGETGQLEISAAPMLIIFEERNKNVAARYSPIRASDTSPSVFIMASFKSASRWAMAAFWFCIISSASLAFCWKWLRLFLTFLA